MNFYRTLFLFSSVCLVSILSLGCSDTQQASQGTTEPATAETSPTKQTACEEGSDCCGGCAAENTKATQGCCGKCAGAEQQTKTAENPADGCGDCSACTDGDSANCKCDDQPETESTSKAEQKKSDEHVNSMPEDRDIFHFLLQNHSKLTRKVTELKNGVETLTESSDPVLTGKIQEHVASMYGRVEDGRRIRMWDTLYQEIFKHADKIEMKLENTDHGIKVIETSDDPYVVKLIQEHAKVVSGFVEHGFEEAHKNHEPPKQ